MMRNNEIALKDDKNQKCVLNFFFFFFYIIMIINKFVDSTLT